ncbi:secretion protein HlyD [gamma proteobacterium HTCC5015]|nr:secretion protein HlyD [gamma proteobacterium HTCC5015]
MIFMLAGCAVLFGGIFGFKAFMGKMMNNYFDNMPVQPATITATEAVADTWAISIGAVGTVTAINGVEVTSQVAGEVERIEFDSGDKVKAGDVLLRLDDRADRAQLQALDAAAKLAEQELERNRKLYDKGSISKSTLEQRQSQRDQAVATAAAQRERVAQKTVRAPFSGELGLRQVDLGEYLTPGAPVVTLQQLNPIYVDFSLPEQHLSKMAKGLKAKATLSAWPGERFDGEITALEPGVDASTRNFNLQATFENDDLKLRPGMFSRVDIQMPQSEDVVVIPRTAIQYSAYGNLVYVVKESAPDNNAEDEASEEEAEASPEDKQEKQLTVVSRFIKLGRERGDLVSVVEGLEEGETVATSGLLKLRNDATVVIDNSNTPSAKADPQPDNS